MAFEEGGTTFVADGGEMGERIRSFDLRTRSMSRSRSNIACAGTTVSIGGRKTRPYPGLPKMALSKGS
jgi:hypothetical protein